MSFFLFLYPLEKENEPAELNIDNITNKCPFFFFFSFKQLEHYL